MKKTKLVWISIISLITAVLTALYFFCPNIAPPILEVLTTVGTLLTPFAIYEMEESSQKNAEKIENSNREHLEKLQEFIDKYGEAIEAWDKLHNSGETYTSASITGDTLNINEKKF